MTTTPTKKKNNPLAALTAGCIAGGIEATAVWPMEYIKTQLQLQSRVKGVQLPYTGMISGIHYTIRTNGFISLYRGLTPTLIGSIPKAGIRFGLNSILKDILRNPTTGQLTPGSNFLAGMGAGITEALIIVAPVETIKTKCIEMNMPFVSGMKHIIKTEGFIKGIYQGAFATALKQGSNQGLRFMWFNEFKRIVTEGGSNGQSTEKKAMTPLLGLLGGMSAGCFSTIGNNPFDVVKTRMQGTKASVLYKNTFDCFQQIIQKEGISGLYSGIVPRLGRVVPGQGIIFMSFETIQQFLEKNFTIMK